MKKTTNQVPMYKKRTFYICNYILVMNMFAITIELFLIKNIYAYIICAIILKFVNTSVFTLS